MHNIIKILFVLIGITWLFLVMIGEVFLMIGEKIKVFRRGKRN